MMLLGLALLMAPSLEFAELRVLGDNDETPPIVEFPDVKGLKKSDLKRFKTRDFYFSISYKSADGLLVFVHMTALKVKDVPDGAGSSHVTNGEKKVQEGIDSSINVGVYKDVKRQQREIVKLGSDKGIETLKIVHNVKISDGSDRVEANFLTCYKDHLIRIICLYPQNNQACEMHMASLMKALSERMK